MSVRTVFTDLRQRFASAPLLYVGPAMCLIVGLASGASAALLKWLIGHMSDIAHRMMHISGGNWMLVLLPVIGILLAGMFQRYVLHRNIEHGSDIITDNLRRGDYYVSPKFIYGPLLASTFTLGFGGSAGSEGPIATCGAALGGNMSRWLGLDADKVRMMIACGAAAGIAGIFKAPVGGMLFALECMAVSLTTLQVIAILATCLISSLTAYVLSGCVPDLSLLRFVPQSYDYLLPVLILGVVSGFYAIYYNKTGMYVRRKLVAMKNPWLRNLSSGIMVGAMLFIFPALYGEGYNVIDRLMNTPGYTLGYYSPLYILDKLGVTGLLLLTIGILLCKGAAAYGTNSGGGVAGDFAPTLFAGAIMGYLFVGAGQAWFGHALPMPVFVLAGMAGVMAGAVRCPLMAIFITVEMTASYEYLL
ncbi:MAG: chloride channel protein, partial [Muribaculaceae bacterium]|nr:chloride channel protein [Muribaculaceae bacterium]